MNIAYLGKQGGKESGAIIYAHEADYSDYKGFLRCTVCGKLVFLRKGHTDRNGRTMPDMFVHHELRDEEAEVCKLRVKNYTRKDIQRMFSETKNQRLAKLKISLWKYLKTNLVINLNSYSLFVKDTKINPELDYIATQATYLLKDCAELIHGTILDSLQKMVVELDPTLPFIQKLEKYVGTFTDQRRQNWKLQCDITKEVLNLFLTDNEMQDLRYRLTCCLFHPDCIQDLQSSRYTDINEWQVTTINFIFFRICLAFLSVNWIKIFSLE